MVDLQNSGNQEVTLSPSAIADGLSTYFKADLLDTVQTPKGSPGRVYGYHIHNPNDADAFVQFLNHAAPTLGTTVPTMVLFVPANGGVDMIFPIPITFSTAIKVAATTTATGSTAPSTGLVTNIWWV